MMTPQADTMRPIRLLVNFAIMITTPIWLAPLAMYVMLFSDDTSADRRGDKWLWDD